MKLPRHDVIEKLESLREQFEAGDSSSTVDYRTMSDAKLIDEYCANGLFALEYPGYEEDEIAGLISAPVSQSQLDHT
jgi:hypothetical protein